MKATLEQSLVQPEWQYVCRTDAGRVRELNEDTCLCAPEQGLWVVADGMGGHSCGEVASAIATESIQESNAKGVPLVDSVQQAHNDILSKGAAGEGADGMGTTAVALLSDHEKFSVAWVGDSRAYLWQAQSNRLTQLTHDHSLVERLLSAGLISQEEAKTHPQRHLITQCLGSKDLAEVKVDTIDGVWESGQILLLCSDGLTEELTDADMKTIFSAHTELDKTASRLLRMGLNKGGQDNISLILIGSPAARPTGLGGLIYDMKIWAKNRFQTRQE